ncbi:MAG: hydrogenase maturation protease [Promethearchaeota archaeon]
MKEIRKLLYDKLKGATKIVLMGIGETKLSDDGVGPYIISELLDYSNDKFLFINAGIDPMGRLDEIINFQASHLVLLDTCTLKKPPGTIAIINRENIQEFVPISTHTIPIHIVIDFLAEKLTDINVFMIGFVPESLEGFTQLNLYKENEITLEERSENEDIPFFDFNLTDTIQNVAEKLIQILKEIITMS